MKLTRRHFLGISGLGMALPMPACAAQTVGGQFIPEAFGAMGDGLTDDYDAFRRMFHAVNAASGGSIAFTPGRKYAINRFVSREAGIADLTFTDCSGLRIEGNGATLSMMGDFHRDHASTRGLSGLLFRDCHDVTLRNLELVGNVDRTVRASGLKEAPSHGLIFQSCTDVLIDQILVRHFAADGLYIRESNRLGPSGTRRSSRRFTVRNSRFIFNARQGLSVIQLRGGLFENCDFSYTGFIDTFGGSGPYGGHSPAAGVDVEPNNTPRFGDRVDALAGDILFRSCRMVGNYGAAFLASKYAVGQPFLDHIRLEACLLQCGEGESGGQDGFIFDVPGGEVVNCTLQMVDKTAYVGWYQMSEASPRLAGNRIYGRNPGPNRPLLEVRRTRGMPVIESNQIVGQHREAKPLSESWLVMVNNLNATFRNNRFFAPSQAFPPYGTMIPAVVANAKLLETNRYETDLSSNGNRFFGILYGTGTAGRNEVFRGTRPGLTDTIRPIDSGTRKAWAHDTRQPWSKF